ncbi:MAG: DNA-deoxyinosine glycosylase [Rhodocyclaceae bacterium]|nr:DNA-deoxyinosine glycosylase [Rhodocyclaceae bacterium]
MLRGLPPVLDARARVLVLGSFPSVASLAAGQYYAHRQNQFWRILAAITGPSLTELAYADRLEAVRAAGIGIWDVFGACRRQGSLDSAIRDGEPNDFLRLSAYAPRLGRVCFNGRTPGRFAPCLAALGYEPFILPSTSPAHAGMSFETKLAVWREALRQ